MTSHLTCVKTAKIACATAIMVAGVSIAARPTWADTAPPAGTPATVSADALPTVQVNGVVWAQVTVGNTVYATGNFSQTWPAGTANNAANDTPRANLLAYDITTGKLITSFNHSLNAQGLAIAASPDGSRVYVTGDFTTVDGQSRNRIAAFDTATGVLSTGFQPAANGEVHAVTATNATVYFGGSFSAVNGTARGHLAAVSAANGGLLANWAPSVEQGVDALVVTPDQSEVVIGGAFQYLNGTSVYGLGAVTTANATVVPYLINNSVRDYTPANHGSGQGAAILSLATDGHNIYGSGYSYGEGNFEGNFAVAPDTGAVVFINDCHGDTYSVYPIGQVLYTASHNHSCQWIGAFPNTSPSWTWHRSLAFTTYATGHDSGPDDYGWNYGGQPDSALLHWYPTLAAGSFTGAYQAAWSVTGNSSYIAEGGEFPSVNGVAQAGLVRFAVRSLAPNRLGPVASASVTPALSATSSTSAKIVWSATWDQDNQNLSYGLYRDNSGPIYTIAANSNFWQLPSFTYTDSGLAAGSTHSYTVRVSDPLGNAIVSGSSSITLPGGGGGGGGGATTSASDNFQRTVSSGWGTATTGGTWTGTSSALRVTDGTGFITLASPAAGPSVYLSGLSSSSTDTTATFSTDRVASGGPVYFEVVGRRVASNVAYEGTLLLQTDGTVILQLRSLNGGATVVLAQTTATGVSYASGAQLKLRCQVAGTNPTTLRLKAWAAASPEPANFQLAATDSVSALQAAGSVGFAPYLSGSAVNAPVTLRFTSFATQPVG